MIILKVLGALFVTACMFLVAIFIFLIASIFGATSCGAPGSSCGGSFITMLIVLTVLYIPLAYVIAGIWIKIMPILREKIKREFLWIIAIPIAVALVFIVSFAYPLIYDLLT